MEPTTRAQIASLREPKGSVRYADLEHVFTAAEQPVGWAYEVWDDLVAALGHRDAHHRAIASQLLCALAKSDPEQRMLRDFDTIFAVTRDAKFVTARHTLLALWQVAAAGPAQRELVIGRLAGRFADSAAEKNCTLIRYDIIQGLRRLYDAVGDPAARATALELIATETDEKYRKKYLTLWRGI